ncbi:MAG: DUF4349 domain-containing protein [Candidatus Dormibacterales bacterium]
MTSRKLLATAALGWAAVLLAGCAQGPSGSSGAGPAQRSSLARNPAAGAALKAASRTAGSSGNGSPAQAAPTPAKTPPGISEGPRVIRTAQVTMTVGAGHFNSALDKVLALVGREGGYIAGTDAGSAQGPIRSGVITFEVPAASFQDAINKLRGLGRLQHLSIQGQDVSAQYVDLEARLANEEAQRQAMLALLSRATTIGDIISIQDQLGQITQQMEEYKGAIGLLDHQTSYSTVAATIEESPAVPARPKTDSWGLVSAFTDAVHGFVRTLGAMLIALGAAGPALLLLAGGVWAYWRWARRRQPAGRARA